MQGIELKELENSEVEITGELPVADFEKYRAGAIKNISERVRVDGFRKGHVPESVLEQKLGGEAVLEEMADLALRVLYPRIVAEKNIDAIGTPTVAVTKLAKGNPFGFKITTAVLPVPTLPDYKKLALSSVGVSEDVSVSDKEVEDTLTELRRLKARRENAEKGEDITHGEHNEEEKKEDVKEKAMKKEADADLPALDDEFIASLGAGFTTVAEAKEKIKENIAHEKTLKARDKKRMRIMEALITETKVAIPRVMVEAELDRMMARMKDDILRAGGNMEDYLKHIKKTEAELRKEGEGEAEKSAKIQLILNNIGKLENLSPDKVKVDAEVEKLVAYYKDADPVRARAYVEGIYFNEAVFEFLESQKK